MNCCLICKKSMDEHRTTNDFIACLIALDDALSKTISSLQDHDSEGRRKEARFWLEFSFDD